MGIPPPPNISMIKYNSKMVDGMNCDFETRDGCIWKIVPNKIVRKVIKNVLVAFFSSKIFPTLTVHLD